MMMTMMLGWSSIKVAAPRMLKPGPSTMGNGLRYGGTVTDQQVDRDDQE